MKPFLPILLGGGILGCFPLTAQADAPPDVQLAAEEAAILQAHSMRERAQQTAAVSTFSTPSKAVVPQDLRTTKPEILATRGSAPPTEPDPLPLPPPIPGPGTLGAAPGIPFTGTRFLTDPSQAAGKMPDIPPELTPLGKVKTDKEKSAEPLSTAALEPPLYIKPKTPAKDPATTPPDESITLSPFLRWVKQTQNAERIAKDERERYRTEAMGDTDPFLTIRFPYLGTENPPPAGGSVIYSSKSE